MNAQIPLTHARPEVNAPSKTPLNPKCRISAMGLVTACGVVASAATALGFLGGFWWVFDLFSHFRVQLLAGLFVLTAVFLLRRQYKAGAIFATAAAINLSVIMPLYSGDTDRALTASVSHRAMLINVNREFGQPDRVARLIQQCKPDLILLVEVSDAWLAALSTPLAAYPHSKAGPREDNFGIALYSRYPLTGDIHYVGDAEIPSVIVEVKSPTGRFTVIGTHPLPPASPENARLRDEQLRKLPDIVKRANAPVLLLGDLNATPWCFAFQRLLRESELRDSSQGRGIQATWPTFMPLLWIPIDHCLYGPGIQVVGKRIGPKVGSDHYPVVVDFVLERPVIQVAGQAPTALPQRLIETDELDSSGPVIDEENGRTRTSGVR